VVTLLQQRLAAVGREIAGAEGTLAEHAPRVPRLFLLEIEYDLAVLRAEEAWMRSLIEEIAGETLPGLDEWRKHHESGEISPELRELADSSIELYGKK
jgi:hypothetical protein